MPGNGSHSEGPPFEVLKGRLVGTSLVSANVLGRQLKIPNLFLKDETNNPSGSMLDRLSVIQVEDALRRGKKTVCVASQDPRGRSLSLFARAARLECVVYVPEHAAERWAVEARAAGARVVRPKGVFPDVVANARSDSRANDWYDATDVGPAALGAYDALAAEIVAGPRAQPQTVAVPTREGSALVGIFNGFEKLGRVPKLIAATSKMGNPIVWSLAQGTDACTDLDPKEVFPSVTSEPLATHKSAEGAAAVKAVRRSGGWGYAASDDELENMAKQLERSQGIRALPAAVAGIAALRFAARFGRLGPDSPHVAIITARA